MKYIIIYIIIYLIIIVGLNFFLSPGFFYNLDTISYPVSLSYDLGDKSLFNFIKDIFSYLLGYQINSKLFFIVTILVGCFLGYKVVKYFLHINNLKSLSTSSVLFITTIIGIISSPFFYERLMTQVHIALGVFMIGLGFIYLLEYLQGRVINKLYISALFMAISFMIFPHAIIFIAIIGLVTLAFYYKSFSLKSIIISIIIILGLNANWLIGPLISESSISTIDKVQTFDRANIEVFTQNAQPPLGVELTTLTGYGFWGERAGHVYGPSELFTYWWIFAILVFIIIGVGYAQIYKKDKRLALYFIALYLVFYILALGISSPYFAWFNELLYNHVPYYIGMREPGKFLGMLAILNAIFFTAGIYYIIIPLKQKEILDIENSKFDFAIFFVMIFMILHAYSPGVLFGFKGQLQISQYPDEYIESREYLIEKGEYTNVVFPWHSYMRCGWGNPRVFSNTYPQILGFDETIKADNIEIGHLYTNYDNPVSRQVETFLKTKDLDILRKLEVDNIVFQDKCADYKNYDFLDDLEGLQKVYNKPYLKIYKIQYEK